MPGLRQLCAASLAVLAPGALWAGDTLLTLPATAEVTASQAQPLTTYSLAIGPFRDGALQARQVEGAVDQTAWRISSQGLGTLGLLSPLREQLQDQGFSPLYECQNEGCGGYDFRYATDVLAEPDMHVDLGDFRYFVAEKPGLPGPEYVALLVSRSAHDGFVQMTRIGPNRPVAAAVITSTKSAAQTSAEQTGLVRPVAPITAPLASDASAAIDAKLALGQAVVLDDLVFPSGSADLAEGNYPSLAALAAWLQADPARKALLVGHTDASGSQEANLRLSRARAESVRRRLIETLSADAAQVTADGAGFLSPRASNATEEGRRQNRRVEVIATPTPATSQ